MVRKYLTITEIVEKVDIPNSTCRRYLHTFDDFFLVSGGSRVKKYEENAVVILQRIKELYENGQDTNEIHQVLLNEFPLVVDSEKQQEVEKMPNTPTLATSEDIEEIKKALADQKEFNYLLLKKLEENNEQIKQQNNYIKESIEKRDQQLMKALEESRQAKVQAAAAEQKPFWKRWF